MLEFHHETPCVCYLSPECQDHDGSPRSLSRHVFVTFTFHTLLSYVASLSQLPCSKDDHFCMRNASNLGAPGQRSVSSICLVLTGRSGQTSAAHTELTCHQNTVLGFSTMGPGRVSAGPGSSPRHPTLGITRSQQVGHMSDIVIVHKIIIFSPCKH